MLVRDIEVAALVTLMAEERPLHTEKQEPGLGHGVLLRTAYEPSDRVLGTLFFFFGIVNVDLHLRLLRFGFSNRVRTSASSDSSSLKVVGNGVLHLLDGFLLAT